MQEILEAAGTAITMFFLFYSSWSDYKTREVSNVVWIVFAPLAFTVTFTEILIYDPSQFLLYGICFGLTAAFSVILFYSGGFGGADAKALMCLALALPFYPAQLFTPVAGESSPISMMLFPITVFSNAVLFAAGTAIYILFRNILWRLRSGKKLFQGGQEKESPGKKMLVLLTGYKMPIERLREKWHLYPLEDIEEEPEKGLMRKLVVIPKDETREATVERLAKAAEAGIIENKVLTTPGLPMLIFITAGLITALFVGDIVWVCVRLLLG